MSSGRSPDTFASNEVLTILPAQQLTANVNGAGVDVTDHHGQALLILNGIGVDTDETVTVTMEESTDDGVADAFAAISPAVTLVYNSGGSAGDTAEVVTARIDLSAAEDFIRAAAVTGGTTPAIETSVVLVAPPRVLPND